MLDSISTLDAAWAYLTPIVLSAGGPDRGHGESKSRRWLGPGVGRGSAAERVDVDW